MTVHPDAMSAARRPCPSGGVDWCIHCPLADCNEGAAGCLLTGPDLARRRQMALAASLAEWSVDVRPHVLPRVFPNFGRAA